MSELKAHDLVDIQDYRGEVYFKSEADKVIARHKYKRCLAMAKWCHDKWTMSLGWDPADGHTADYFLHYRKWEKRWLELAEKRG